MWEIVGQVATVRRLSADLAGGSLPHALLFVGRSGAGKTTLALQLAMAMNCTGDKPPCGQCVHCRQISGGAHPDVTVVERPEGRDSIAIQQVRELRDGASLRPFQGRQKVYIIAGAEFLTPGAADALLKTLEEPPRNVTIILTALEADSLSATIVSRCRLLTLGVPSEDDIAERLQTEIGADEARRIARLARGNVGWALRAARSPKLVRAEEEAVLQITGLADLSVEERLRLAETLAAERRDRSGVRRALELVLAIERDKLLLGQDLPPQTAPDASTAALRAAAQRIGLASIHKNFRHVTTAMRRLDSNVDPRLTLEALFLQLA